jgi:hypothetical protein
MAEPSIWTQERKEYLVPAWKDGKLLSEMMEALNRMDGIAFTHKKQISEKARKLRIRRPAWYLLQQVASARNAPRNNPKPVEPKPERILLWPEERKAAFVPMWQNGDSVEAIMDALNAMKGIPLTKSAQLADKAKSLGIRRPIGHIRQVRGECKFNAAQARSAKRALLAPSALPKEAKPLRVVRPPIKAPLHVIYRYGCELRDGGLLSADKYDDIDAINRAIQRLSHERLSELFPQFSRYSRHPGFTLLTRWLGA